MSDLLSTDRILVLFQPLVRAAIILLVAILGSAILKRWGGRLERHIVEAMLRRGPPDVELEKRAHTLVKLGIATLGVALWVVAVPMVLRELGFDIGPLLAGAGVAGIAIGFGAQALVRDVITGALMLLENQLRVGDVAVVNGTGGLVERMNLRTLVLRGLDGTVHVFPNGTITTLSNMTQEYSYYVFDLGVAYGEDTDRVVAVLRDEAARMAEEAEWADRILEPIEVLGVDGFADSAVKIKARIKTRPIQQWAVGRELNRRIKKRFDADGIEIPFPYRTVVLSHRGAPLRLADGVDRESLRALIREVMAEDR